MAAISVGAADLAAVASTSSSTQSEPLRSIELSRRIGSSRPGAVNGSLTGEHQVLAGMYRSYRPLVSRYLVALLRRRGGAAAGLHSMVEDLVQEVFLRAFTAAERVGYDGGRDFSPFLLAVAKNCFRDLCRRDVREEHWDQEQLQAQPGVDAHRQLAEQAQSSEVYDRAALLVLSNYVQALPEDLRRVYERRFVKGQSQEAAADALGLSRAQLRTRENRIVTGLRGAIRAAGIQLSRSPRRSTKPRSKQRK